MRIIALLLVSFSCSAQSTMPPPFQPIVSHIKRSGNTNDYQPHYMHMVITDTPSKSPDLDVQILWGSTNINPYSWTIMVGVYDPTQAIFTVSTTNYPREFFYPQVGNTYGLWSKMPL